MSQDQSRLNTITGRYFELMTANALSPTGQVRGGKGVVKDARKVITDARRNTIKREAFRVSHLIRNHCYKLGWGIVTKVEWTPYPQAMRNAIGPDFTIDNPSDMVVWFTNHEPYGISLKTKKEQCSPTFRNPGINNIFDELGKDFGLTPIIERTRRRIHQGEASVTSEGQNLLELIRDTMVTHLESLSSSRLQETLLRLFGFPVRPNPPYMFVMSTPKGVFLNEDMWSALKVMFEGRSRMEIIPTGRTTFTVYVNEQQIMRVRVKFDGAGKVRKATVKLSIEIGKDLIVKM